MNELFFETDVSLTFKYAYCGDCVYTQIMLSFLQKYLIRNFRLSGEWSCWTDFGECSVTCGEGVRKRTRNCMLKGVLAEGCEGPSESLEPCYVPCQNTDIGWEAWSDWSVCDKDNRQQRTRRCSSLEQRCLGPEIESVPCFETNRIGKRPSVNAAQCPNDDLRSGLRVFIFILTSSIRIE